MSRFQIISGRVPCGSTLKGYKTRVLDPSMLLFRGERKKIHALLNSPMFFSTHEVAMLYSKLGCDAVRATQPLCLFEFSLKNVRRLSLQLNNNDLAVLKIFFGVGMRSSDYKNTRGVRCKVPRNKSRSQPMICTEGFLSQSDADHEIYIAKRMAYILCAQGFDGWYMPPNTFSRTSGVLFHEEILVCNPAAHLRVVGKCNVNPKNCLLCAQP
jgi:hypothetical protein